MKNLFKNPFKKKVAPVNNVESTSEENAENASEESSGEDIQSDDSTLELGELGEKTEKELIAERKAAEKAEKAEKKKIEKAEKAERKKVAKAERDERKKVLKAEKDARAATKRKYKDEKLAEKREKRSQRKKEGRPPRLTKDERRAAKENKAQTKQERQAAKTRAKIDKMRARTAKKVSKIRARAAIKRDKLQMQAQTRLEQQQAEKEVRIEIKELKRELREELKAAREGMPKSKGFIFMIVLLVVMLITGTAAFLGGLGIGPLADVDIPNPIPAIQSMLPDERPGLSDIITPLQSILPGSSRAVEATVISLFEHLAFLDFEGAEYYTDISTITVPPETLEFVDQDLLMNTTFDRLSVEILETTRNRDADYREYHVIARVTAVDVRDLLTSYSRNALQFIFENAITTPRLPQYEVDEIILAMYYEMAGNPNIAMLNADILITVRSVNGDWRVIHDRHFINAIFGGLLFTPEPLARDEEEE